MRPRPWSTRRCSATASRARHPPTYPTRWTGTSADGWPAATKVQAGSARAGEDYHLPDGPQARARNDRLAAQAAENRFGPHAGAWGLDTFDEQAS